MKEKSTHKAKESKSFNKTARLVSLVLILACVTFGVKVLADNFGDNSPALLGDSGNTLGMSNAEEEDEDSISGDAVTGVSWLRLRQILLGRPGYSDSFIQWLKDNHDKIGQSFPKAVKVLAENPSANEADDFIDYMLYFKEKLENPTVLENGTTTDGLSASTYKLTEEFAKRNKLRNSDVSTEKGDSIAYFEKTVTPTDDFRHFEVKVTLEPKASSHSSFGASSDIIILMNASESMEGDKLDSAKEVAKGLVNEALQATGQNRVALVVYREDGVLEREFSDVNSKQEIITAIDGVKASGGSSPQAGIVAARKVLGIADGEKAEDGRKQVILHLSDGSGNISYTDQGSYFYPTSYSDYPEAGQKRWTTPTLGYSGFEMPSVQTSYWSENADPTRTALRLGVLEAQYTVAQGVEIYVIDYSDGENDYLELSTAKMIDSPKGFYYEDGDSFTIRRYNPAQGVSYQLGSDSRIVSAGNSAGIIKLIDEILVISEIEAPMFEIRDVVNKEIFEIVDTPKVSPVKDAKSEISIKNAEIIWTSWGTNLKDERTLTYTIKAVDRSVVPEGSGEFVLGEHSDGTLVGDSTTVSYSSLNSSTEYQLDGRYASLRPLLSAEAWAENPSGSPVSQWTETRNIVLKGKLTQGDGEYDYSWSQGGKEIGLGGIVTLAGEQLEFEELTDLANGKYNFLLRIDDSRAANSGYTAKGVAYDEISVKAEVLFGRVVVTLEGDTSGAYETSIEIDNGATTEQYYFVGLGSLEYELPMGATVSAKGYAPTGFVVSGGSTVKITPNGGQDYQINLRVNKQPSPFYYGWSWAGSSLLNK